jgi:hypothetical protein
MTLPGKVENCAAYHESQAEVIVGGLRPYCRHELRPSVPQLFDVGSACTGCSCVLKLGGQLPQFHRQSEAAAVRAFSHATARGLKISFPGRPGALAGRFTRSPS